MNGYLKLVLAAIFSMNVSYACAETKVELTGALAGAKEIAVIAPAEAVVKKYVETLWQQDFEAHRATWHPQIQACITPDNLVSFKEDFKDNAQYYARHPDGFKVVQFLDVHESPFPGKELEDVLKQNGRYLPVKPTYLVVADVGVEKKNADGSTAEPMTAMIGVSEDTPGHFSVVKDACPIK